MEKSPPKAKAFSYVRMSTDLQLKGDSLRRQLQQSREFAEKNGLDLVEGPDLQDIGVSAFKGANISGGALGRFLEAVTAGTIKRGSFLLVESLDRISRQEVMASLSVFMSLVNSGIYVVTLADGHVYEPGKTDLGELILSIVVMSRAHEESLTKSHRGRSAWANKRKNLSQRKLTSVSPAWLTLSPDGSTFEVNTNRADVVRMIYRDSLGGVGSYTIARRLNEAGVKPFGNSNGWQPSYITKLLTARAVLGEFQPHRKENGRRVPEGDPIRGYFPQIIDDQLFLRVQASRDARRSGAGGRRGKHVSNIFSGIATCANCGSRMHFVNKGVPPKGGTYLVCDGARRGLGCESQGWRYDSFEASFLAFVQEVDLETLISDKENISKRTSLSREIGALRGSLVVVQGRRERTYCMIDDQATPDDFIRQKLAEAATEIAVVEGQIAAKSAELLALDREMGRLYRSEKEIKALIERLQSRNDPDVYLLRATIAARLRVLVGELQIAANGDPANVEMILREGTPLSEKENGRDYEGTAQALETDSPEAMSPRPHFAVTFRDGGVRIVSPDPNDPLRFKQQLHRSSDKRLTLIKPTGLNIVFFPPGRGTRPVVDGPDGHPIRNAG